MKNTKELCSYCEGKGYDIFQKEKGCPVCGKHKNACAKTVFIGDAYEVWTNETGWTWNVLKKYQADDNKPFARWHCFVTSPFVPDGEFGDEYVENIKGYATRIK